MDLAELILAYLKVLIWPVTVIAIVLIFRKQLYDAIHRIQKADLPGGVSLDFGKQLAEAQQLSVQVASTPRDSEAEPRPSIPLTEANTRMIELGLQPSPSGLDLSYYSDIADRDPNLALAGLRIEIDILGRNLAKGFGVPLTKHESGIRLVRRLYDAGAITEQQMELTLKVLQLANVAVHGQPITKEQADGVIEVGELLVDQYVAWLTWGFDASLGQQTN